MVDPINSEVLKRFREGDGEAFTIIFESFTKSLVWFVRNIIKDEQDANDIVADVMLKLWRDRAKIKNASHLSRWLYTAARNAAIDYFKRERPRTDYIREQIFLQTQLERLTESEYDKSLLLREWKQLLDKAIQSLPPQRQAVIILHFYAGMTTDEIAATLKISPQTVLNHKSKAIDTLRKRLPSHYRDLLQ
ncbi:MAG TPA: RNA polymerase sigma-70 factor [Puia sp.]|jgi:RNA polymerase sigma-70 factor (family 1)|nr:RNA polymerase sigma-70 factor [Puia sp.]